MSASPVSAEGGRIRLAVRVTPRARCDEIGGIIDMAHGRSALVVRLAAPPVEGAANKALVAFLAKAFGVSRSAVTIVSGESSRLKLVELDGVTPGQVEGVIATPA